MDKKLDKLVLSICGRSWTRFGSIISGVLKVRKTATADQIDDSIERLMQAGKLVRDPVHAKWRKAPRK